MDRICHTYRYSIDFHRDSIKKVALGKVTVLALRAVMVALHAGAVSAQTVMVAMLTAPWRRASLWTAALRSS